MYDLLIKVTKGDVVVLLDYMDIGAMYVDSIESKLYVVAYNDGPNGDKYVIDEFDTKEAAIKAMDNICKGIANGWKYIKLNSDGSCDKDQKKNLNIAKRRRG